jgi:hypothetical protein
LATMATAATTLSSKTRIWIVDVIGGARPARETSLSLSSQPPYDFLFV